VNLGQGQPGGGLGEGIRLGPGRGQTDLGQGQPVTELGPQREVAAQPVGEQPRRPPRPVGQSVAAGGDEVGPFGVKPGQGRPPVGPSFGRVNRERQAQLLGVQEPGRPVDRPGAGDRRSHPMAGHILGPANPVVIV
jgi:hypothetical protein